MLLIFFLAIITLPIIHAEAEESHNLKGLAGYFEGRVRQAADKIFTEQMLDRFLKTIEDATKKNKRASPDGDKPEADYELKDAVQLELKKRIEKFFEDELEKIVKENILGEIMEKKDIEEAEKIYRLVAKELNTSMNEKIDLIISDFYNDVTDKLKKLSNYTHIPEEIDIMDIKGSIREIFTINGIKNKFRNEMAVLVGDASANAVEKRIAYAFGGRMPPEFARVIDSGPKEFDKYVKKAEKYLPGKQLDSQLDNFRESILDRPAIKVPTPVYVSALAMSASAHFSRAYDGVVFNAYEAKRGVEVTRVMIWQAENKDWVSLSILQMFGLSRDVAARIGMGDKFEGVLEKMKEPLARLKKIAGDFDKFVKKPAKDAGRSLRKISNEAKLQFKNLQDAILEPVKTEIGRLDEEMKKAGSKISGLIPDWANGVPKNWEELKKRMGIKGGLLGKDGEGKPLDALSEIAEKIGIKDEADDVSAALGEIKDDVLEDISAFAVGALEDLKLLGPTAEILDVEKTPAENESKSRELDPVLLHNGEFVTNVTDVVIPGRGIDFRFTRAYRGRSKFLGEFGWRWTHSFAMRLLPAKDGSAKGLIYIDEEGRKFFFGEENGNYKEPQGIHAHLEKNQSGGIDMLWRDGNVSSFDEMGKIIKFCDRYKNCETVFYDKTGLASSISDVFGRKIEITRRRDGLIAAISDFSGRTFRYEYNEQSELIGVTFPAVEGFENGKTTAYRYTDAPDDSPSAHQISLIVDPKGQAWLKNKYDNDGRVTMQSYGGAPWAKVAYAENDAKNPQGDVKVKTRAWVTDSLGRVTLYENDADGHLLRMWRLEKDGYKLLVSNYYNGDGDKIAECRPSGRCILYFYGFGSARGDVLRIEDHPGDGAQPKITTIEYESEYNRPVLVTNSYGEETRYEYGGAGDFLFVNIFRKNSDGESVLSESMQYNSFGQLIKHTDIDGNSETYDYFSAQDPDGDGVPVKDAAGEGKEGGGYLKYISGSKTASFEYDPIGNIIAESDENKILHRYSVNALNEITKEENSEGVSRIYTFDANDNVTRAEWNDKNGTEIHEYDYDSLDRVTEKRVKSPDGKLSKTNYYYNEMGLVTRIIRPEGGVDEYEYDDEERLHCQILGANSIERSRVCMEYDADGDVTAVIDGDGGMTVYERDGFGALIAVIDPTGVHHDVSEGQDGEMTSFTARQTSSMIPEYDGEGRLIALADSAGNTTYFAYDKLGRLAVEKYADGSEKRFAHNANGDVTGYVGRDGRGLLIRRDGAGRLLSRSAADADGRGEKLLQTFEYDEKGRLKKAVDHGDQKNPNDDVVTQFEYSEISMPIAEYTLEGWLMRSYDKDGLLNSIRLPSGEAFYYIYNDNGTVNSIYGNEGKLASYEYDPAKLSIKAVFKNDFIVKTLYNREGLAGEIDASRKGYLSIGGFETHYENGRAYKEYLGIGGVERIYSRDDKQMLVSSADTFLYDETEDPKILRKWDYTLDPFGNVVEYNEEGIKMKYNEVNECTPVDGKGQVEGFKFDENGYLISDGEREFHYDALGRLADVSQNGRRIAEYRYDVFDRRVAKIIDGKVENAVWEGWRLVERNKDGLTENYAYLPDGLAPFAVVEKDKVTYLVSDRLMSIYASVEDGEKITARCSYSPFGKEVETLLPEWSDEIFRELLPYDVENSPSLCRELPGPFRFAGQIYDDETGFIYMRHRYYDPRLGRFITPDPLDYKVPLEKPQQIGEWISLSYHRGQGGASRATFPNRPIHVSSYYKAYPFNRLFSFKTARDFGGEANLYLYARGDPSTFVDPFGLASIVFDRSDGKITFYDRNENEIVKISASNNVGRKKNVNPLLIGKGGPFPNGTFTIGIPEFYTPEYQNEFYRRFGFGNFIPGESGITGPKDWSGEKRPEYNISQGLVRFRAGSMSSSELDRIAWERQLFVHGGRYDNYRFSTFGCIRAKDSELEILAAKFVEFKRIGDPVETLTVQD